MAKESTSAFSPEIQKGLTVPLMNNGSAGKLVGAGVVGEMLGLKKRSILKMALRGQIPHVRLNTTTVRFDLVAINAWIDAQRVEAKTTPGANAGHVAAPSTTGEGDGADDDGRTGEGG